MLFFFTLVALGIANGLIYFFTRCLMYYVVAMVFLFVGMLLSFMENRGSLLIAVAAQGASLAACVHLDRLYGSVMVDYRLLMVQLVLMLLMTVAELVCFGRKARENA